MCLLEASPKRFSCEYSAVLFRLVPRSMPVFWSLVGRTPETRKHGKGYQLLVNRAFNVQICWTCELRYPSGHTWRIWFGLEKVAKLSIKYRTLCQRATDTGYSEVLPSLLPLYLSRFDCIYVAYVDIILKLFADKTETYYSIVAIYFWIWALSCPTKNLPPNQMWLSHIVSYLVAVMNGRQCITKCTTTWLRCPTAKPELIKMFKDGSLLNKLVK